MNTFYESLDADCGRLFRREIEQDIEIARYERVESNRRDLRRETNENRNRK